MRGGNDGHEYHQNPLVRFIIESFPRPVIIKVGTNILRIGRTTSTAHSVIEIILCMLNDEKSAHLSIWIISHLFALELTELQESSLRQVQF